MRLGDLVYVSFKGRNSVGVRVAGFPRPGIVRVSFLGNTSRSIEVEYGKIKLNRG